MVFLLASVVVLISFVLDSSRLLCFEIHFSNIFDFMDARNAFLRVLESYLITVGFCLVSGGKSSVIRRQGSLQERDRTKRQTVHEGIVSVFFSFVISPRQQKQRECCLRFLKSRKKNMKSRCKRICKLGDGPQTDRRECGEIDGSAGTPLTLFSFSNFSGCCSCCCCCSFPPLESSTVFYCGDYSRSGRVNRKLNNYNNNARA